MFKTDFVINRHMVYFMGLLVKSVLRIFIFDVFFINKMIKIIVGRDSL